MTKERNISKSIRLCIKEQMKISMECLPLGAFSGGLYLDLLISVTAVFLSHRCESVSNKPTRWWTEELLQQKAVSVVTLIRFCTGCYWIPPQFNPSIALFACAVIWVESIHVKTFRVEHLKCWCVSRAWYPRLLSAKLLQLHGNDCTVCILYFLAEEICYTRSSTYLFFFLFFFCFEDPAVT